MREARLHARSGSDGNDGLGKAGRYEEVGQG